MKLRHIVLPLLMLSAAPLTLYVSLFTTDRFLHLACFLVAIFVVIASAALGMYLDIVRGDES